MALEPVTSDDDGRSQVAAEAELLAPSNPMLIDVVIDNMFGYCDFETLDCCRQVSKQWFKVSLPHWLKQGPTLKLSLNFEDRWRQKEKKDFTYMPEFLYLIRKGRSLAQTDTNTTPATSSTSHEFEYWGLRHYKKFEVMGDVKVGYLSDVRPRVLLDEFLQECGEWITDLKLSIANLDLTTFQTLMLSRMTPNLVKLDARVRIRIDNENFDLYDPEHYELEEEEEEDEEYEVHVKLTTLQIEFKLDGLAEASPSSSPVLLWIQILKRYPNLETLVVDTLSSPKDADNMLEALWTIRRVDRKALDLKRLEVYCSDWEPDDDDDEPREVHHLQSLLPLMRDAQLALETFRFSIGEFTPNQTIYQVLESQAPTLKTLVLHNHKNEPLDDNFQPPHMNCLETLKLYGQSPLFLNLAFLKSFPKLKSLTFSLGGGGDDELVGAALVNYTNDDETLEDPMMILTLTKLHCNYEGGALLRPEDIRKLHRVMPNVTDLEMWLDNESFRAVCGCWPGLKSLTINGNDVGDEGIIGRVGVDGNMLLPNFRNLKELESFCMTHIDNGWDDTGPTITGDCVNQLFTLPKLKKLKIGQIAFDEVLYMA